MKLSVIIPAFNEEKYLGNCLSSLEKQSVKPDEILVIDNNSSDKTAAIAKNFGALVITENKKGITYTRNKGFNSAGSEIIARCDADTIAPKHWIRQIKDNFSTFDIDALTGPSFFYDLPIKTSCYSDAAYYFNRIAFGYQVLNGNNLAITKNIWHKVRNYVCNNDKYIHEDMDLAIHITKAGGKIRRDSKLRIAASGRRLKSDPFSAFAEYPLRGLRTIFAH